MFKKYTTVLAEARKLSRLDAAAQRRYLLNLAKSEDLLKAIRISIMSGSPFLIEALHNDLSQEHQQLVDLGKIKQLQA